MQRPKNKIPPSLLLRHSRRRRKRRSSKSPMLWTVVVMSVTTALGALAFGVYIFSGISRRPKTALAVRPVLTQTEKERVELLYRQVRPRFNDPTSERIIELNRSEVNLLLKAFQAVHPEKALVHAEITFCKYDFLACNIFLLVSSLVGSSSPTLFLRNSITVFLCPSSFSL